MEKEGITTDPGHLEWAGVAVFKKAYRALSRARLSHSPVVGGVSQSHALERVDWRRRRDLAAVGVAEAIRRQRHRGRRAIDTPVDPRSSTISIAASPISGAPTIAMGSRVDEFDDFAPTRRTLRQFLAACDDLSAAGSRHHDPESRREMIATLTMAQALVRFLGVQFSERDGRRQPFFAGVFGIFGHGNVAGIGQALDQLGGRCAITSAATSRRWSTPRRRSRRCRIACARWRARRRSGPVRPT